MDYESIPPPPSDTMRRQHGSAEARGYERVGVGAREDILSLLGTVDWTFDGKRVLDFGAGAGRVVRHMLPEAERCEMWACDIDEPSLEYMRAHLSPPLHILDNEPKPPLAVPDQHFDLIWTVSVFTHLTTDWADWMAELHRVLADDGLLIATYASGEIASRRALPLPWDEDGVGMCVMYHGTRFEETPGPAVWHSGWWLDEHWGRGFEILERRSSGFAGATPGQGVVLMRKRAVEVTAEMLGRIDPAELREIDALRFQVDVLLEEIEHLRGREQRLAALEKRRVERPWVIRRLGGLRRRLGASLRRST